ncbi:Kel3p NDAI_0I02750 [Naumovozyma dairenensis CBS 421]|uniref:DUF4110 domain-containing protein n=1 Tax=Naumovozyma dairenensis (strain ATCC 10597 / BCRC 20456 / CBS 421 / NBRC 0211 / NRRL Y-12639) TaxID=1071378 RepID=G0WGD2_NAUDC|nr:hypothetical protein NDAI_0I02750 [Naumovozyma dairenensis CBS 421]CCD26843.1 hypothetical protein NDAI_0I02750 [Naumovozyma dairenensis CBS 421]
MAKKSKKDKDAKKARAEQKLKKNQAKAEQKDKKKLSKNQNVDGDDDDLDIETVLANFKMEQEKFEKINVELLPQGQHNHISPRSNSSMITAASAHNKKGKELLMFGGEYTSPETGMTHFYNDLLSYTPDTQQWRKITSQNSPMPRSSAAMCYHPSGIAILHGGEFSSPKQNTFYHYSDTWILDTSTKEWTKVDIKKSPVARSGHRIVHWKNYFVLFGGFKDIGNNQTNYFNDVWCFDILNYKWTQVEFPKNHPLPDPRSGHSWIPVEEGCILWGGYTKVKSKLKSGQQKGKILNDCWYLKMKSDLSSIRWERRKKLGFQPSPRVGCSMAYHKGRGILFGGVYDFDETEESLESLFYNDLFSYNVETNRWFALNLRKNQKGNKSLKRSNNKNSKEKEKELQDLLNQILEKNNLKDEDDEDDEEVNENEDGSTTASTAATSDDEDTERTTQEAEGVTIMNQLPHPRYNVAMTVVDDLLFIYGGSWELGEKDYFINSFYSIDLNRIDGVTCYWEDLKEIEKAKELGEQDSDEEDDEDDEEDDDEDDDEEEIKDQKLVADDEDEEEEEEDVQEMEIPDLRPWLPHPKPFESLRAFYIREGPAFLEWAISNNKHVRGKHLKKKSFELCEDRWWERRDQIRIEEDKLEELGVVGDVIEKDTSKGASKRR